MVTNVATPPEMGAVTQDTQELQAKFDALCTQVANEPLNADLRARLGYAAVDLGRRMEAIGAFVRAFQLDPSLTFVRARLQSLCTPEELKTFRVPEEVTPFWKDIPGLLTWPLRGSGLGMLIIGAVILAIAAFVARVSYFGFAGYFIQVVMGGYLAAYFVRIVKTSGVGRKEAPDWPDIAHPIDIYEHALNWSLAGMSSFLPAIFVPFIPGLDGATRLALFGACVLLGAFLHPMALLVMALYGSGFATFHYSFVVGSIMRIMGEYVRAWGVLLVLAVVMGLLVFMGGLLGFGTLLADEAGSGGLAYCLFFLYLFFCAAVFQYGYMVFCRLLGQVYYFSRNKLGWFEE